MGWLADLLKEIPSAARYRTELEKLTSEHKSLESKLTAAEAKIRELEGKLSARQGKRLDGIREEMLVAREGFTSVQHASALKLSAAWRRKASHKCPRNADPVLSPRGRGARRRLVPVIEMMNEGYVPVRE